MNPRILALITAAAFVASVVLLWQWRVNVRLQREIAGLRVENQQLAAIRAENERLAAPRAGADVSAPRPQRDAAEPPFEAATANGGALAALHPTPIDRSSPRAVAASVRAAIEGGDPDTLINAITIAPEGLDMAEQTFEKLPPHLRERYGTPERMVAEVLCASTPPPAADRLLLDEELAGAGAVDPALADDESYRTLHTIAQEPNGTMVDRRDVYRKTDDGWRWVVSSGEVLRRLAETGLVPQPATAPSPGGSE